MNYQFETHKNVHSITKWNKSKKSWNSIRKIIRLLKTLTKCYFSEIISHRQRLFRSEAVDRKRLYYFFNVNTKCLCYHDTFNYIIRNTIDTQEMQTRTLWFLPVLPGANATTPRVVTKRSPYKKIIKIKQLLNENVFSLTTDGRCIIFKLSNSWSVSFNAEVKSIS